MTKKALSAIAILPLAILATACGKKPEPGAKPAQTTESIKMYVAEVDTDRSKVTHTETVKATLSRSEMDKMAAAKQSLEYSANNKNGDADSQSTTKNKPKSTGSAGEDNSAPHKATTQTAGARLDAKATTTKPKKVAGSVDVTFDNGTFGPAETAETTLTNPTMPGVTVQTTCASCVQTDENGSVITSTTGTGGGTQSATTTTAPVNVSETIYGIWACWADPIESAGAANEKTYIMFTSDRVYGITDWGGLKDPQEKYDELMKVNQHAQIGSKYTDDGVVQVLMFSFPDGTKFSIHSNDGIHTVFKSDGSLELYDMFPDVEGDFKSILGLGFDTQYEEAKYQISGTTMTWGIYNEYKDKRTEQPCAFRKAKFDQCEEVERIINKYFDSQGF